MARTKVLAILTIGIGLVAPLVVAEAVLRFLPVQSGLRTLPVNEQNPVRRFTPNREFTFSKDWDFKLINRGRTNNFGFVNDRDYDSTAHSPLLAVIGDSYVEAQMVPFPQTLQGRLSSCVGESGRVYSFAVAGAPLSQYLAEANFARSKFRPDGLVVVVVGNDFDESLRQYNHRVGFHYFRQDSDSLVLDRVDYSPSGGRRLMRNSALIRYVTLNLAGGVTHLKDLLKGPSAADPYYVGNTTASFTPERLRDSRRAVEEFLSTLPDYAGLDPGRILLVVDGIRPQVYSDEGLRAASGSYFDLMRHYLIERGEQHGFEVLDMQPRFVQRHARDGTRFEFSSDHHWNWHGHEEAANAVASSRVFKQIFPASCLKLAREDNVVARP
jgi:hypothetical protein